MKKITLLTILFFAFSCSNSKNEIKFINNSEVVIDSVKIFGNKKCNPIIFYGIKPNSIFKEKLINCDSLDNDGSFLVKIFYDKKNISKHFGYYTNGYPVFKEIIFDYNKNDIINIKEFH
ncbi:hypothetical protein [Flavobacterium sp.]|uniref:hypothetical protein n=1 Tax=Flavobacterium sp. TaxID=239 RepID=UPI002629FB56|nr:hypothetical protein [Flavobacterium sp.]